MSNKCLEVLQFDYLFNLKPIWEYDNGHGADTFEKNVSMKLKRKFVCGVAPSKLSKKGDILNSSDFAPTPFDGLTDSFVPYSKMKELSLSKRILIMKLCEECCEGNTGIETKTEINYTDKKRITNAVSMNDNAVEYGGFPLSDTSDTKPENLTPKFKEFDFAGGNIHPSWQEHTAERNKFYDFFKDIPNLDGDAGWTTLINPRDDMYLTPYGWKLNIKFLHTWVIRELNKLFILLLKCNPLNKDSSQICTPCTTVTQQTTTQELVQNNNSVLIPPLDATDSVIQGKICSDIKEALKCDSVVIIPSSSVENFDVVFNDILITQYAKDLYFKNI